MHKIIFLDNGYHLRYAGLEYNICKWVNNSGSDKYNYKIVKYLDGAYGHKKCIRDAVAYAKNN